MGSDFEIDQQGDLVLTMNSTMPPCLFCDDLIGKFSPVKPHVPKKIQLFFLVKKYVKRSTISRDRLREIHVVLTMFFNFILFNVRQVIYIILSKTN